MPDFRLPDLGEGLTEATVISWLVQVGDVVTVDQPVAEVETAKAAVEVPVPFAGVVTRLHAEAGQSVAVGTPLVSVGDAAVADTPSPAAGEGSGNVLIGYGTKEPVRRRRRTGVATASPAATTSTATVNRPVISPLVRKVARDRGIDLAAVAGSGPDGMVLRRDLDKATPVTAPPTPVAGSVGPGETRVPFTPVHRAMAAALTRSRREIPEATVWVDVDATAFLAARRELDVPLVALLARFVVLGLRRYPALNGRVEPDAVVLSDAVDVGFAAQTPRGLVDPVVKGAQAMTTRELGTALTDLTARARDGALTPADLTGGTVTVNNYGVFGVDGSAAIVNHPQVAIVGMGRIVDKPWVVDGALAVRKVTELTIAFDHRACDGGTAGGFLRFVADCVESPVRALADL